MFKKQEKSGYSPITESVNRLLGKRWALVPIRIIIVRYKMIGGVRTGGSEKVDPTDMADCTR